jgi:hypothetical protein
MDPSVRGWMPPEALAAAAAAGTSPSWKCAMCSLLNGPCTDKCEGCDTHKMVTDMHNAEERRAAERAAAVADTVRSAKKTRGKGTKLALNDLHKPSAVTNMWGRGL